MGSLYEEDETLWRDRQIELLEQGRYSEIDMVNLKVMLVEMGDYDRYGIAQRMVVLISHLLKWKYQPSHRGKSWHLTIEEQRDALSFLRPTLRQKAQQDYLKAYQRAVRSAVRETKLAAKTFSQDPEFSFDQMLDDDFWPEGEGDG